MNTIDMVNEVETNKGERKAAETIKRIINKFVEGKNYRFIDNIMMQCDFSDDDSAPSLIVIKQILESTIVHKKHLAYREEFYELAYDFVSDFYGDTSSIEFYQ